MRGVIVAGAGDGTGDDTGDDVGDDATGAQPAAPTLPPALRPVRGRPLIHHPLALLLLAGIRHILVVASPPDLPRFQRRLGGGERWGIHLSYAFRPPGGPARAVATASEFTGDRPLALALGEHIVHGPTLPAALQKAAALNKGARIFAAPGGRTLTGLGFYDHTAPARARALAATRSGAEAAPPGIPDLNDAYRADGALEVRTLDDDVTWFDVGHREALPAAEEFVRAVEQSSGVAIGCPGAAARRMGFIGDRRLPESREQPRRG